MNLDELIRYFDSYLETKDLAKILSNWKNDDEDIMDLSKNIEYFFSRGLIQNSNKFNEFINTWDVFKSDAIDTINGLTMNERLYWFGFLKKYDLEIDNEIIYTKLCAKK